MNNPEPLAPEIEALVLGAWEAAAKKSKDAIKAIVAQRYSNGDRHDFVSPLGGKLGYVHRSNPVPAWVVTDETALMDHLATFPGLAETVYDLAVPGVGMVQLEAEDELAQVLLAHARHMLTEVQRIRPSAVEEALVASRADDKAAAPGIELVTPAEGTLIVKPDPGALDVVRRLVRAGQLTWDGARPAVEAAAPEAVAS